MPGKQPELDPAGPIPTPKNVSAHADGGIVCFHARRRPSNKLVVINYTVLRCCHGPHGDLAS
jgi:hypothetical protein